MSSRKCQPRPGRDFTFNVCGIIQPTGEFSPGLWLAGLAAADGIRSYGSTKAVFCIHPSRIYLVIAVTEFAEAGWFSVLFFSGQIQLRAADFAGSFEHRMRNLQQPQAE